MKANCVVRRGMWSYKQNEYGYWDAFYCGRKQPATGFQRLAGCIEYHEKIKALHEWELRNKEVGELW